MSVRINRRKGRLAASFFLAMASSGVSTHAETDPPRLKSPVDCEKTACFIPRYVDRDPGPGALDYACGSLTADGHKGTDIAVPPIARSLGGVTVAAAAPGRVKGLRDGMPDISLTEPDAPNVSGRECGNGVVIAHENGWETQYCHLQRGSIAVRKGQQVVAGTPLGMIGLSGETTFVHLHFSLRQGKTIIDPFRADMSAACDTPSSATSLWMSSTGLYYRPGGLIQIGVLDRVPDYEEIKQGLASNALPDHQPDALVLWGYVFAGRRGDTLVLELDGPDGKLGNTRITLETDQPLLFRAWGRKAPPTGFEPGAYEGRVEHWRDGARLDIATLGFTVP